jgi:hypothetical protein
MAPGLSPGTSRSVVVAHRRPGQGYQRPGGRPLALGSVIEAMRRRHAIQNVGTGVDYPDPGADPFCVEFDKTSQSVLPHGGLVDLLANEPAVREVAA